MSTTNTTTSDTRNITDVNYNERRCTSDILETRLTLGTDPAPYIFRSTRITNRVHHNAIRFGRTNDISVLYKNETFTKSDRVDYVIGASATSILILSFILLWFCILLFLRYVGPDRVGLFSGKHPTITTTDVFVEDCSNKEDENDKGENHAMNVEAEQAQLISKRKEKGDQNDEDNNDNDNDVDDDDDDENDKETNANLIDFDHNDTDSVDACNRNSTNDINGSAHREHQDSQALSEQNNVHTTKSRRRLNYARIVVLLSSLGTVICICLFLISGTRNLRQSANIVIAVLEEGKVLTMEAWTILNNFIQRQTIAFNELISYVNGVNEICPAIADAICSNTSIVSNCDFDNLPFSDTFAQVFQEVFEILQRNEDNITELLSNLIPTRSDLEDLHYQLESVANQVSTFSWAFVVAAFFAVALLICNLGISYAIIVVWYRDRIRHQQSIEGRGTIIDQGETYGKVVRIVRHRSMVPILCVLVVISWIFSMIFAIGSITSADFCYGTPDDTMLELVTRDVFPLSSFMKRLVIFYIEGCPDTDLAAAWEPEIAFLSYPIEQVQTIVDESNSTGFRLSLTESCGTNPVIVDAAARTLELSICNLGIAFDDLLQFFTCENWRQLYTLVTYDAVCFNGNEGFFYVARTQFWIVFFTMIMITLRVTFQQPVIDKPHAVDSPNNSIPTKATDEMLQSEVDPIEEQISTAALPRIVDDRTSSNTNTIKHTE